MRGLQGEVKALQRVHELLGQWALRFGDAGAATYFVVGTGRCGTSLLQRLLRAHSGILDYPSEANEFWHPRSYPYAEATIETPPMVEDPALFTKLSLEAWPEGHQERIQRYFTGFHLLRGRGKVLVVKSAMISFMIQKLHSLFPKAKFVHIYRNGPSVVESWTKKEWTKKYADRCNEDEYRRFAAVYWAKCLLEIDRAGHELGLIERGAFHQLSYESLCDSPEAETERLAHFLDVSPDGFQFDTGQIQSTNYKAGAYDGEFEQELLRLMEPAMALKGYT